MFIWSNFDLPTLLALVQLNIFCSFLLKYEFIPSTSAPPEGGHPRGWGSFNITSACISLPQAISILHFIAMHCTYLHGDRIVKEGEISFALMIDRTNVQIVWRSIFWNSSRIRLIKLISSIEHILVGRNKNCSFSLAKSVVKNEVRTNEHILVQMNKKMFNRSLKFHNFTIVPINYN